MVFNEYDFFIIKNQINTNGVSNPPHFCDWIPVDNAVLNRSCDVVIFERVKEELKLGKTVRSSVESGFNRALSAVIDSNVTTIISAVILWWLGTGTIKGFGMTLLMGVIVSMFSAIFVTKFLLKQMIGMNVRNNWLYGVSKKKTGSESVKGGEA